MDNIISEYLEHLKVGRKQSHKNLALYPLLSTYAIEKRSIAGKDVYSIGAGVLIACLAEAITREEVEPLAQGIVEWHKSLAPAGDTTCVFRDSSFQDDVAKTNLAAILGQHGIANVRSL